MCRNNPSSWISTTVTTALLKLLPDVDVPSSASSISEEASWLPGLRVLSLVVVEISREYFRRPSLSCLNFAMKPLGLVRDLRWRARIMISRPLSRHVLGTGGELCTRLSAGGLAAVSGLCPATAHENKENAGGGNTAVLGCACC